MPASTARREGRRGAGPAAGAAWTQGDAEQSRRRGARGGEEIHWRQVAVRGEGGDEQSRQRGRAEGTPAGRRSAGGWAVRRGRWRGEEPPAGPREGRAVGRRVATDLGRRPRGRGTRGREEGRQKLGKLLRWSFSACSVKKSFWSFRGLENLTRLGELVAFGASWRSKSSRKLPQTGPEYHGVANVVAKGS